MAEQRLANGITLHLVDEGEGRPVVFVHGVMMSSRFFDRQVEHVSASARMVAPDLRGHAQGPGGVHRLRDVEVRRGEDQETGARGKRTENVVP